jgi:hypothetical protein
MKRYSSGMYVRLAFSVAAHLEPEILLVDEVLVLEDAVQQRFSAAWRTSAVPNGRWPLSRRRSTSSATAHSGSRVARSPRRGDPSDVVSRYLHSPLGSGSRISWEIGFRVLREGPPVFGKIKAYDKQGDVAFNAVDIRSQWDERSVLGRYVATAWIPGNILNEGLRLEWTLERVD